ncbi:MAG: gliding motility-associated C-terminal domain-containing protein, partial [Bacteroidaceae bacterium]
SESKLEMPNAFSPNGDGQNDVYKAKEGYQSIVSFHAYIFNRWGKKIYEWTTLEGGWNGCSGGTNVKDGVYFCLVEAKGADGRNYTIKKSITLLRGYDENKSTSTTSN